MAETFPIALVGETLILALDFAAQNLATGETLSSPSVTITLREGSDGNPDGMRSGAAQFSGTEPLVLLQKVICDAARANNDYTVVGSASSSQGQTLKVAGVLRVRNP